MNGILNETVHAELWRSVSAIFVSLWRFPLLVRSDSAHHLKFSMRSRRPAPQHPYFCTYDWQTPDSRKQTAELKPRGAVRARESAPTDCRALAQSPPPHHSTRWLHIELRFASLVSLCTAFEAHVASTPTLKRAHNLMTLCTVSIVLANHHTPPDATSGATFDTNADA